MASILLRRLLWWIFESKFWKIWWKRSMLTEMQQGRMSVKYNFFFLNPTYMLKIKMYHMIDMLKNRNMTESFKIKWFLHPWTSSLKIILTMDKDWIAWHKSVHKEHRPMELNQKYWVDFQRPVDETHIDFHLTKYLYNHFGKKVNHTEGQIPCLKTKQFTRWCQLEKDYA